MFSNWQYQFHYNTNRSTFFWKNIQYILGGNHFCGSKVVEKLGHVISLYQDSTIKREKVNI